MEPTTVIEGKNLFLDLILDELNVKQVVLRDKDGKITKIYDGTKTEVYN